MNTAPGLQGRYRDRLFDGGGEPAIDAGWRANRIVDNCNRLLANLMMGQAGMQGVLYLAIGEGQAAWAFGQKPPDIGSNNNPEVIVDSAGDIWLFWRSNRSGKTALWVKLFSNGNWGDDTRLTTSTNDNVAVSDYSAIVDKYGDIWVIWSFSGVNRSDIWYTRNRNGSWDKARKLTHDMTQTSHRAPSAVLGTEGGIQVSWTTKNEEGKVTSWLRKIITSV